MAVGAFAIITDNSGKVLLCKRTDGQWNLPGGTVEKESPRQAVIRECREETGLEVEVDSLLAVYCFETIERAGDIVFTFRCSISGGKLTLSDEAIEIEYFNANNLPENLYPNHRQRILDSMNIQKDNILKIIST